MSDGISSEFDVDYGQLDGRTSDTRSADIPECIRIDYGVMLPTWPAVIVVVKPVGEDRLLAFACDVSDEKRSPTVRYIGPCEWDLSDHPPVLPTGQDRLSGQAPVD